MGATQKLRPGTTAGHRQAPEDRDEAERRGAEREAGSEAGHLGSGEARRDAGEHRAERADAVHQSEGEAQGRVLAVADVIDGLRE